MTYRIVLTPSAQKMMSALRDRRVLEKLRDRIDGLANDPEMQGKALIGELSGYRSLRAVGQRYRIVYRVRDREVLVVILAIGLRKEGHRTDIYALAQKLLRLNLIQK